MEYPLCKIWPDEMLDRFLEEYKREEGGLTFYPVEEWAEKVYRNFIKNVSNTNNSTGPNST